MTLLGAVVTLTILSIMLSVGLPQLNRQVQARALRLDARALAALVRQARSLSLETPQTLMLCGSRDGKQCDDKGWQQVILRLADGSRLQHLRLQGDEHVVWRGVSTPLIFHHRWRHNFLNGTFSLCPIQDTDIAAWRIIISRLGRPRLVRVPNDPRCAPTP
ncbi:hypothetical protein BH688_06925 [Kushneria phosphatilytica]|nr:hypothetical protein BH688_06925 [Kushneria phosphatilytica]